MWLGRLLDMAKYIYKEYPELFTEDDIATLLIVEQLIRSLK